MSPMPPTRKIATLKKKRVRITTKTLTPELWDDIAELFAAAEARPRIRSALANGELLGVIACADEVPVGWCSFRAGVAFSGLTEAPGFGGGDFANLGGIPAFHVKQRFRHLGVGQALLLAALSQVRLASGGVCQERGPLRLPAAGRHFAREFSPTGTETSFRGPRGGRRLRLVD